MAPRVFIVMGVAGSGKTTVGRALGAELGWRFVDADDFHPPANVAKMSAGLPLTDADRAPWLDILRGLVADALSTDTPMVLACSALKTAYRDRLAVDDDRVRFVYLTGSPELLAARIAARTGHFAPPSLLASQLATLEKPDDARTLALDIAATPAALVAEIRRRHGL